MKHIMLFARCMTIKKEKENHFYFSKLIKFTNDEISINGDETYYVVCSMHDNLKKKKTSLLFFKINKMSINGYETYVVYWMHDKIQKKYQFYFSKIIKFTNRDEIQ